MPELFELVLTNHFFLILILGAIISLFRGSKTSQQQRRKDPATHPRQTMQQTRRDESKQTKRNEQVSHSNSRSDHQLQTNRHFETKQQQQVVAHSHRQLQHENNHRDRRLRRLEPIGLKQQQSIRDRPMMEQKMKRNLTRQGLIDSIVMAEVLGPPRARKRYRNIVSERRHLS